MKTVVLLLLPFFCFADLGQEDCQENEVFVHCGLCEATCWEPEIDCSPNCKPARCECLSSLGYVRSRHGHCVSRNECPGPNIYSLDVEKGGRISQWGEGRKRREIEMRGPGPRTVPYRPNRPYLSLHDVLERPPKKIFADFAEGRPRQAFGSHH